MSYDKLFVEVNGEKRKCFNLTKTLKKNKQTTHSHKFPNNSDKRYYQHRKKDKHKIVIKMRTLE